MSGCDGCCFVGWYYLVWIECCFVEVVVEGVVDGGRFVLFFDEDGLVIYLVDVGQKGFVIVDVEVWGDFVGVYVQVGGGLVVVGQFDQVGVVDILYWMLLVVVGEYWV